MSAVVVSAVPEIVAVKIAPLLSIVATVIVASLAVVAPPSFVPNTTKLSPTV